MSTSGKDFGVVGVALEVDVKQFQLHTVGHVVGNFMLPTAYHKQREENQENIWIFVFHFGYAGVSPALLFMYYVKKRILL